MIIVSNIYSDPNRLRQILINLINNSLKFTITGSVTIKLSLYFETNEMLKCEVIDTGIGIPPELCKKLFSPYVKGVDSMGINKTGAGFGLSITKRLCERLGGRVEVSSIVGRGSTFNFIIPLNGDKSKGKDSSLNNTQMFPSPERNPRPDNRKAKILCVDDAPMAAAVIQGLLNKLDIKCDIVIF